MVFDAAANLEYLSKKPIAVTAANATGAIVAPRQAVLSNASRLASYAHFFSATEVTLPTITDVALTPDTPVETFKLGWLWTLSLSFSRYDGDTLTGHVVGTLTGTPPTGEA